MQVRTAIIAITTSIALALLAGGCGNDDAAPKPKPRKHTGTGDTATTSPAVLPPGHPQVPGYPVATGPAGAADPHAGLTGGRDPHAGMSGMMGKPRTASGKPAPAEGKLRYSVPSGWEERPARPMTKAVYALPKADGDQEDAELTVSFYPDMRHVTLEQHVARWAGWFTQPDNRPTSEVVKQVPLERAATPTTLVEVTGRYQPTNMMGEPTGAPRDNYRLLVGAVDAPEGPWFFRLMGPAKTVTAHQEAFAGMLRAATQPAE